MRTPITVLCAAALCVAPFAPAVAEPEPDNALWEATGPVLTDTIAGTIADTRDHDWYMLYAAANTPMTVTLQPACRHQEVTLRDSEGRPLATLSGSDTLPASTTYTTGPQTTQFLLRVGIRGGACAGSTYTVTLSPGSALLPGAPMPTATPLAESTEAIGPLAGDTWYSADLPVGDGDAYYFYADAPLTVKAISQECEVTADLDLADPGSRDPDEATMWFAGLQYAVMPVTPGRWDKFSLSLRRDDSYNPGCPYRFLLTPASTVKSGPRPLTPPTTKVKGLTYKRAGKRVTVRWKPLAGATLYLFRYPTNGWCSTRKTHFRIKAKVVPKKGLKVQVRARNNDGTGPMRTIRVRL